MLFQTIFVCVIALPFLAAAIPAGSPGNNGNGNNCSEGSIKCCDTSQEVAAQQFIQQYGPIAIPIDLTVPIQLSCTQVSAILGFDTISCSQQLSCCSNSNEVGTLVGVNCSPLNVAV